MRNSRKKKTKRNDSAGQQPTSIKGGRSSGQNRGKGGKLQGKEGQTKRKLFVQKNNKKKACIDRRQPHLWEEIDIPGKSVKRHIIGIKKNVRPGGAQKG